MNESRELFNSIKADTSKLSNSDVDEIKMKFTEVINDKMEEIHQLLYDQETYLIELILNHFQAQFEVISPNNLENEETNNKVININSGGFEAKLDQVMKCLDIMIAKTNSIDSVNQLFQTKKLEELFALNNNEFKFKLFRHLGIKTTKSIIDITWDFDDNIKRNFNKMNLSSDNLYLINLTSSSCNNWFTTTPQLDTQDFLIELETNIIQRDNHFYVGLMNEKIVTKQNCMCVNCPNAFYLKCDGEVAIKGTKTKYPVLDYSKQVTKSNIIIKVLLSDEKAKQIFFSVNDSEEVGPLYIEGQSFRIFIGCCNNVSGSCNITSSYYL